MKYENYIFDLYGTLVDIHTDEEKTELWEKLAQFYGYYGAVYTAEELKNAGIASDDVSPLLLPKYARHER